MLLSGQRTVRMLSSSTGLLRSQESGLTAWMNLTLKTLNRQPELREQEVTLYELMEIAEGYDLIANEWTSGFGRCLEGARSITEFMQAQKSGAENSVLNCSGTGINEAIVYTFLKLLSRHRDTFIETKFDKATAESCLFRAGEILSTWETSSGR